MQVAEGGASSCYCRKPAGARREHALERERSMNGDSVYFSRRGSEERLAATKAVDPRARQAHLELASRYDELAAAIGTHERVGAGLANVG